MISPLHSIFTPSVSTMYCSRADLLNGLKNIIDEVEKLRGTDTSFVMNVWSCCVIGKVINNGQPWGHDIERILKEVFNAELCKTGLFSRVRDNPFCPLTDVIMNSTQYDVIMLFTHQIGNWLSPEQWLENAYSIYNSNMGIK